jgi:hypothetical protein
MITRFLVAAGGMRVHPGAEVCLRLQLGMLCQYSTHGHSVCHADTAASHSALQLGVCQPWLCWQGLGI